MTSAAPSDDASSSPDTVRTALLWHDNSWRARVIKNEEDDGWAPQRRADSRRLAAARSPYVDVWLWDKSGNFQLATLTRGQRNR